MHGVQVTGLADLVFPRSGSSNAPRFFGFIRRSWAKGFFWLCAFFPFGGLDHSFERQFRSKPIMFYCRILLFLVVVILPLVGVVGLDGCEG
jgi:hypothetical protein